MAKIFRLSELQERKRLLVAESEVYRQTLKLEVQNIRLYTVRVQKKFALMRLANPLFLLAGSLAGTRFFGRKRSKGRGKVRTLLALGMMSWRLFRNYGPLLQALLAGRRGPSAVGDEESAANS